MYTFIKGPFLTTTTENRKQKKPKPDLNLRSAYAGEQIVSPPILMNCEYLLVMQKLAYYV